MLFRKSKNTDLAELTRISREAFFLMFWSVMTEFRGPPGFDSEQWHRTMLEQSHLYTLEQNNTITGGAVLFGGEQLTIGRIF